MSSFKPEPLATQYHFELTNEGRGLSVAIYLKGHQAPDMFDYLPDTRIMDVLKILEQAGYAVRMYDHGNSAKAIKDQPTRIDFLFELGQWTCKKYLAGWTASTPPIDVKPMTEPQVADREFADQFAALDTKAQIIIDLLRNGYNFADIAAKLGVSRSVVSQKMMTIQSRLATAL